MPVTTETPVLGVDTSTWPGTTTRAATLGYTFVSTPSSPADIVTGRIWPRPKVRFGPAMWITALGGSILLLADGEPVPGGLPDDTVILRYTP